MSNRINNPQAGKATKQQRSMIPVRHLNAEDCPLTNGGTSNPPSCAYTSCLHNNANGVCIYVSDPEVKVYAAQKMIPLNRASRESKEGVIRIKTMTLVDHYFDYIRCTLPNQQAEEVLRGLEFPFDFEEHRWTLPMLKFASKQSSLENFCKEHRWPVDNVGAFLQPAIRSLSEYLGVYHGYTNETQQ